MRSDQMLKLALFCVAVPNKIGKVHGSNNELLKRSARALLSDDLDSDENNNQRNLVRTGSTRQAIFNQLTRHLPTQDPLQENQQASFQSGRKLPQVKGMLNNITEYTLEETADIVKNYGCFCYVTGDRLPGARYNAHAKPVDELDQLCKKLSRAERCLAIDSDNGKYIEGKDCEISSGYHWFVDRSTGQDEITCGFENQHRRDKHLQDSGKNCRMELCNLEKAFAIEVKKLLENKNFVNNPDYFKMSQEKYNDNCKPSHPGNGDGEHSSFLPSLACCGTGLHRKSYNSISYDCCDDGSIRPYGLC